VGVSATNMTGSTGRKWWKEHKTNIHLWEETFLPNHRN